MADSTLGKRKVVVTRDMGPDAMALLEQMPARSDLDLVLWPEDRNAPREWLLEHIQGAEGILVTLNDKVAII